MHDLIPAAILTPLTVLRRYHRRPHVGFTLPVDRYQGWVVLAPGEGRFECRVSDSPRLPARFDWVTAGEVVVCPPGAHLHRRMPSPVIFHFLEFTWLAPKHSAFTPVAERLAGKQTPPGPWRILSSLSTLRDLADQPADATARGAVGFYVGHLVRDILLQCLWRYAGNGSAAGDAKVLSAAATIRERFGGPLQISELATALALSPSQLSRRFSEELGVSPVHYLTMVRIQEAARLLTSTHDTLDQIAEACGYANGFYLSRVFKREMGVPPSTYRREHQV